MSKIIVIDEGVLTARSINAYGSMKLKKHKGIVPKDTFNGSPSYKWMQTVLGSLKRIGVDKDDTIIVARDKTKSWRKIFYPNYKGQRWAQRDEQEHINWRHEYKKIDEFLQEIDQSTNWHIIWLPQLWNTVDLLFTEEGQKFLNEEELTDRFDEKWGVEADDIIACASKVYNNKEVIFISIDCDLDMLCTRPNTKYFNLMIKYQGGRGVYKNVKNGYDVLVKKIEKGDKSDNILPGETDDNSPLAQDIRKLIIDLINLPSFVEEKVAPILLNLPKKEIHYDLLPFKNSLAKKFDDIYKKDKIVTYEQSMKYLEKKKKRTAKKAKEQRELKKKQSTMIGE